MDEVQKSSNNECYTPSSESFRTDWMNIYETSYLYHCTWAYLKGVLHKFHQSVFLDVYPSVFAKQRLFKNVTAGTNTDKRIIGRVVFNVVRVVSKESRWLVLPRTSCIFNDVLSSCDTVLPPSSQSNSGYFTIQKIEGTSSSETLQILCQFARRYTPQHVNLRCER
jgi:hypothetical protein